MQAHYSVCFSVDRWLQWGWRHLSLGGYQLHPIGFWHDVIAVRPCGGNERQWHSTASWRSEAKVTISHY